MKTKLTLKTKWKTQITVKTKHSENETYYENQGKTKHSLKAKWKPKKKQVIFKTRKLSFYYSLILLLSTVYNLQWWFFMNKEIFYFPSYNYIWSALSLIQTDV